MSTANTPVHQPRRLRRWLLGISLTVLVLLIAAVAIGPWIASRIAPGVIESAAADSIKGTVKVERVNVGWFSPIDAGPITLLDPQGQKVAAVQIDTPITLWQVVSGRWWSADALDLGTLTLTGDIDLVRFDDGTTNLDRAIEPRTPANQSSPSPSSSTPSRIPDIKARLQIARLDATMREQRPDGTLGPELGVQSLVGPIDIALDQGSLSAKADLSADVLAGAGSPTKSTITLDASATQSQPRGPSGFAPDNLESATVSLDATNLPTALVDALGSLNGALQEGLGATTDATVRIDGNLSAAAIDIDLSAPAATANIALTLADGYLVPTASAEPALALNLASTSFLARLPQLADALERARESLSLESGPPVSLTVTELRVPVPAQLAAGTPLDPATLDLRGSSANVVLNVGALTGAVLLPAPTSGDQPTPAEPAPFTTEPLRITLAAPDLAKPASITGGTRATLNGASAGQFSINATADGLLDEQGRLRALQPNQSPVGAVTADITLNQLATALAQPFLAAFDLPLDITRDVGPTLDLALRAHTTPAAAPSESAAGLAAIPPTDATLTISAANLSASAATRLEQGVLRTTGDGIRVNISSAAPVVTGLLAADDNTPPPVSVDGAMGVELAVTDLAADLNFLSGPGASTPLAAIDGQINLAVTDLRATLPPTKATDTQPAIAAAPITIPRAALGIALAQSQAPRITLDAQATTTDAPAPLTLTADITADGLKSGSLPSGSALDRLIGFRLAGQVQATSIPPAILRAVPQLAKYAPTTDLARSELDAAIASALGAAVGAGADATFTLGQPQGGGGQVVRVQLATKAQGAGADIYARLTQREFAITGATTFIVADPASINRLVVAATTPAEPAPASSRPITLDQRAKLWVRIPEPIVVPLMQSADGGISPDFARAKTAVVTLASENELVVSGIPVGSEPGATPDAPAATIYTGAKLAKLEARVEASLAALAGESAKLDPANRAHITLSTEARNLQNQPIATVSADARAAIDGSSPQAVVRLADINTASVDTLLRRDGLITGALGDRANIALHIDPGATAADSGLRAEITSPTISGASLSLAKRGDAVALTGPSNITWTPAPAFLNSMLVTTDDSPRVTETSAITVNLTKLAIATGPEGAGLLAPGVFDLDAQIAMPRLAMELPAPAPEKPSTPRPSPTNISMETISARARWDAAAPAIRQSAPGALTIAANIAGISGGEGPAARPSKLTATIRAIADPQGNPTPDNAVVNAEADLSRFPTALIDRLANQGGLLTELLGPTVSAAATLRNVSRAETGPRGNIEATLSSSRASANIKGDVRRGQFIQSGPTQVRLIEIRPQLVDQLAGSLPLVATMEKTTSDDPGIVEATDLSIPLDQDMSKLNGVISIDPGVARFTTQSIIGSILKAVGGRESGAIGRKIDPFVVRIDKGVASYERFRLPLGEFSIETRGTVDLVNKKVNLVAYVPFFAITDEAMGPIKLGIGGRLDVLDRNTLVPITIKGNMDKPSAMVDVPMFLQETGQNILQQPGRILEGIGDILGGKKKENGNGQSPSSPPPADNPK